MIKIVHVATVGMGLRYLLLHQLLALKAAGYDVYSIASPDQHTDTVISSGIPYLPVSMCRTISPLRDLYSLWQLFRIFRRERFTIVHTHNPKPGLLGQIAARLAGVPVVVNTLHGFYFHDEMPALKRRFYIWIEKLAASCSDIILSQNSEDIQTAITEGICAPEKIKYLGNGIDLKRFNPAQITPQTRANLRQALNIPLDCTIIGFVGRLVAEKGLLELMEATRLLYQENSNIRLLVVGPVDEAKIDAITPETASVYGIANICIFTGLRQDMPEMYSLMDIFVLPSYREGFPRSLMEASAMGIPCIASNIRGCRETVNDGYNGRLIPARDSLAIAGALRALLNDREAARRMGENGRRVARERFDEQQVFATIQAEYSRQLKRQGFQGNGI